MPKEAEIVGGSKITIYTICFLINFLCWFRKLYSFSKIFNLTMVIGILSHFGLVLSQFDFTTEASVKDEIVTVYCRNLAILWSISLVKIPEKRSENEIPVGQKIASHYSTVKHTKFSYFSRFSSFLSKPCWDHVVSSTRNIYGLMLKLGNIMENFLGHNSWKKILKWDTCWSDKCLAVQYRETGKYFVFSPFSIIFFLNLVAIMSFQHEIFAV